MEKLPFTDYDFWAYLSAGFLFLVACDHAYGSDWMLTHAWSIPEVLVTTATAYVVGHLIAGFAAAFLETGLTKSWLGSPIELLMGQKTGPKSVRWLFKSYFRPLPVETQSIITTKSGLSASQSEPLFWIAFNTAKLDEKSMRRISSFQNLYGMCRNLAFTFLAGAILICAAGFLKHKPVDYWWSLFSLFLGMGMFFRYLKFFRHYVLEVLTTFAYAK